MQQVSVQPVCLAQFIGPFLATDIYMIVLRCQDFRKSKKQKVDDFRRNFIMKTNPNVKTEGPILVEYWAWGSILLE